MGNPDVRKQMAHYGAFSRRSTGILQVTMIAAVCVLLKYRSWVAGWLSGLYNSINEPLECISKSLIIFLGRSGGRCFQPLTFGLRLISLSSRAHYPNSRTVWQHERDSFLWVESWELTTTLPWGPMSISRYVEPQRALLQLTEMHGPLGEMLSPFDTKWKVCWAEKWPGEKKKKKLKIQGINHISQRKWALQAART